MLWSEIRRAYPDQWLIIEALQAHTEANRRRLDHITVIETCTNGTEAIKIPAVAMPISLMVQRPR